MKKIIFCALLAVFVFAQSFKAEPVAYKIFDKRGREVSWKDLVQQCKGMHVVFFGELHNNPISHWLQLKLTQSLFVENKNLVLGAEMFEADQQILMNEYLSGKITEKNFEAEMRLWTNYKTDYKPLVNFAVENKLKFVATNIPRRYASVVSKKGKDELANFSDDAKKYMCPLPLTVDTSLKGYSDIMKMDMGHGTAINMVYAQAVKDATMAHFINKNLISGGLFLHYNGAYHSDNFQGIMHYLQKYNVSVACGTITTVMQKDASKLEKENFGKADFTIVVDEEMTGTH
ncbi:MAG TPA: ChaN family lipoprotein [Flavobacteriales bacterium]|nr:ChaN family lipoprotein [Flavobacteriales bacterium]